MADNNLKNLSRKELLEIMIKQAEEIEELQAKLKETEARLQDRELKITNAGSIAEASLELSGIFETAQKAADQYLDNVRGFDEMRMQIEDDARKQAEVIIAEAEKKAAAREEEARQKTSFYWDDLFRKLEAFYAEHEGLKELIETENDSKE